MVDLFACTYALVRQVPSGRVTSYGAVATALGDRVASRAVGRMMNQNPDPETMPCFKVVHSDGRLGGFGLGIEDKVRRLTRDHVKVQDLKIVDFPSVFFDDFKSEYPLRRLHQEQERVSQKVRVEDDFEPLDIIGGVDVAYPQNEFAPAIGAYIGMDAESGEVVETKTVLMETHFPFVPTYFTFRELPFVQALLKKVDTKPSIVLLDGQGILHPVRCGFASHAGVACDIPTIGVAKSHLYGKIQNGNVIATDGEVRGLTVVSGSARQPLFVSPGHRVSLESSGRIVKQVSTSKHPEPLRLAHQLAVQGLREAR